MRKNLRTRLRFKTSFAATIEQIERRLLMSTYTVNTLSDAVTPVSGFLTLRQAVADANANAGADTIDFSSSVFTSTTLNTISLSQGEIDFTDTSGATTLNGAGSAALVVDGAQRSRVFGVSAGVAVSMNGLTITGGTLTSAAAAVAKGGGIENAGSLSLTNVVVSNNIATGGDSAADNINSGAAYGGGIYSTGTLTLIGSTVSGNIAAGGNSVYESYGGDAGGAGIYSTGTLTVTGSSIISNNTSGGTTDQFLSQTAGNALGGGIFSSGQTTLGSSNILNNSTNGGQGYGAGESDGGGLYLSAGATLTGDVLNNNQANGGDDNSTEGGAGGNASGGAIFCTASISIGTSTLTGNTAIGGGGTDQDYGPAGNASGGAIAVLGSLTISNSTVSTNVAQGGDAGSGYNDLDATDAEALGGGIYATHLLNVTNCTVTLNKAQGASGGRQVDADNGGPGEGGGIATLGTGTISNSTISANDAIGGVAYPAETSSDARYQSGDAEGGGVLNIGNLKVIDTTISENQATGGNGFVTVEGTNTYFNGDAGSGSGGGIFSLSELTVENSTLSNNSATGGIGPDGNSYAQNAGNGGSGEGGGIYTTPSLTLSDSTVVQNTVIAGTGGAGFSQNGYTGTNGSSGVAEGGGVYAGNNSLLNNSIVSANSGASGADVYSTLSNSSSHNLIGYGGGLTNGTNGNLIDVHDPMLGTLADNGGPTFTMLPLAGSPVINVGSNTLIPSGITTDQRGTGFARIVGTVVDIGAAEYDIAPAITLTPPTNQTAMVGRSTSISPGSFTESNAISPFTITVKWGDGSTDTVFKTTTPGTLPAQSHTYTKPGSDTITVLVVDSAGTASSAQTFTVAVSATAAEASTIKLTASAYLSVPGTAVTFIATVIGTAETSPTGTVDFSHDGLILGTATLNDNTATFTTTSLPAGTNSITASYGGDHSSAASKSSPVIAIVQKLSQISSAFVRSNLSASAVAGEKFNARFSLSIANGSQPIKSSDFTIDYYANTIANFDGNQILLTSETRKFTLNSNKHLVIKSALKSLPSSLLNGSYYVLAEVIDPYNLISTAATTTRVTVAAPLIDLSATINKVIPAILTTHGSGYITITIANNGNITAAGLLEITVNPYSNNSVSTQVIGSFQMKTTLPPSKHRTFKIHLKLPASLGAGIYFPSASINFAGNTLTAIGSTSFSIA